MFKFLDVIDFLINSQTDGAHKDAFVILSTGGGLFTNTASYCLQMMVDFSEETYLKQGEVLFEIVLSDFDFEVPNTLLPDLCPFSV